MTWREQALLALSGYKTGGYKTGGYKTGGRRNVFQFPRGSLNCRQHSFRRRPKWFLLFRPASWARCEWPCHRGFQALNETLGTERPAVVRTAPEGVGLALRLGRREE